MEFIISETIKAHPMALRPPRAGRGCRRARARSSADRGLSDPAEFFVERLSEGVGTIAAAFWPKPVIVRLSDFKTNEYARCSAGARSSRTRRIR